MRGVNIQPRERILAAQRREGGRERESVCVCVQCVKFRVKRTESNFELIVGYNLVSLL